MLAAALLAGSLALTPAQSDTIDALVARVMSENHIAGLSIGIARNGDPLFVRGYGSANRETGAVPDGNTIYGIGSLTKQFTAALVLQEAAQQKLSLSQTAYGATVQQLLAQTSGLPTYTTAGATIDAVLKEPPLFKAGTQWAYSNTNYYVLGTLLQNATGIPYGDLLARQILDPLHLERTHLALPSGANAAIGYDYDDGGYIALDPQDANETLEFSAAGMSSSVNDMLQWLNDLRTGKVVSAEDFDRMTNSAQLTDGAPTHYGYGFYIRNWYGWRTAEHAGNVDGYSADDAIVVDDGLEIVVLANASNVWLLPLTKSVVAMLEPPRDTALVVSLNAPPVNENPRVTREIRAIVLGIKNGSLNRSMFTPKLNRTLTRGELAIGRKLFTDVGPLRDLEFVEHSVKNGVAYEKYRVTFSVQQFWVTISYYGWKINTLSVEPDNE